MAFLEMRGIVKRYPGVLANDRVDLSVEAGGIHAMMGENGAGKSTLIGILAGMQQPDEGEILIDGNPVRIASPRASLSLGIGTVFQHVLLVPSLSVIENLMLGGPWRRKLPPSACAPCLPPAAIAVRRILPKCRSTSCWSVRM